MKILSIEQKEIICGGIDWADGACAGVGIGTTVSLFTGFSGWAAAAAFTIGAAAVPWGAAILATATAACAVYEVSKRL